MTSPTRPDLLGRSSFSRKVSHSVLSKSPCTDVLSCVHTWSTTWTQLYVGFEPSSHHLSTEENHNCSLYLQPSWQVQISTTYTTRLIFRRILLTNILSVSVAIATTSPSITHLEVRNLSCKWYTYIQERLYKNHFTLNIEFDYSKIVFLLATSQV